MKLAFLILLASLSLAFAQTNVPPLVAQTSTNQLGVEEIRADCIARRRCVCGKVIQIVPEGIVVDSGYLALMEPPLNQTWLISRGPNLNRNPNLLERNEPASACVGLVLLTDIPRRPAVKLYDYVLLQSYPAGDYVYVPVPGIQKVIRKYSAGIDTAVRLRLTTAQ